MASEAPLLPQMIKTPIVELLGIRHPVLLAGMNLSGSELAAAVSNAGGLGVIGGVQKTPKMLRREIDELKALLATPDTPFGVDLLLPQVGGSARATNHDYTNGELPALIDIIIESKAKLFVSAVGVPPRWVVDKLHAAGIVCMNMIGSVRNAQKAVEAGMDILCAQGTEGGGHTGEVATMVLIPQVVDFVRGKNSPLTGKQIPVVAAGGIHDGRGVAASLALGAQAVWVGTRFAATHEAKTPTRHLEAIVKAKSDQTVRSTIYTGRPMRVLQNTMNMDWENNRKKEMLELQSKGIIPFTVDERILPKEGEEASASKLAEYMPLLMGQVAGSITEILPARVVLNKLVVDAAEILKKNSTYLVAAPAAPSYSARL